MPEPDGDRITVLFREHARFVWRVLRRLGVPDPDVDDALQEVFVVVHRRLAEYEERGAVRAWLFTISRQVASEHRRGAARAERRNAVAEVPHRTDDPYEAARRAEAAAIVRRFLQELPEPQALAFYLADVEGLTVPEIAQALETNLNTVYSRLRLARQRFEEVLKSRELGGGGAS